ncbi:hypothetical protein ACOMHN_023142 [Nucella lapillus]
MTDLNPTDMSCIYTTLKFMFLNFSAMAIIPSVEVTDIGQVSSPDQVIERVLTRSVMTNDHHKEVTGARQSRYDKDTRSILAYLSARNPFDTNSSLRNIATGVTCDKTVKADRASEAGAKIIEAMVRNAVLDYTSRRTDQVVTMDAKQLAKMNYYL